MFSSDVISACLAAAKQNGIRPAALLALVEVETAGVTFECDGRTPQFLYERHVAWREAAKRPAGLRLRAAFAAAGLAIPKWSRSTQYKDEGNSTSRLALIRRARTIDEETANRSASWGIGQTMGFLAEELGFGSANEMVDHMVGNLGGQLECMIRELKNKHLIAPLNDGRYATVARIYNGAGYAANRYDTRLADADKRWTRKLAALDAGDRSVMVAAPDHLSRDEWLAVQTKLRALGYSAVGVPTGLPATKTVAALAAFQTHEGLPVTGKYDEATRAALATAQPIEQPRERQNTTVEDLKNDGSKTIATAGLGDMLKTAKATIGATLLGGAGAEHLGLLETAQGGLDTVSQAKGVWESFCDLASPLFAHPIAIAAGVAFLASAIALHFIIAAIKAHRLADHQSGVHAGPAVEG